MNDMHITSTTQFTMRYTTNDEVKSNKIIKKISSVQELTVDSSQVTFVVTSKSRDTKTRPSITNPAQSNLDIVP